MPAENCFQFIKQYMKGRNKLPSLGEVWGAGWDAAEAHSTSCNSAMAKFCPHHKSGAQCVWGLRGFCKKYSPCEVRAELRQ